MPRDIHYDFSATDGYVSARYKNTHSCRESAAYNLHTSISDAIQAQNKEHIEEVLRRDINKWSFALTMSVPHSMAHEVCLLNWFNQIPVNGINTTVRQVRNGFRTNLKVILVGNVDVIHYFWWAALALRIQMFIPDMREAMSLCRNDFSVWSSTDDCDDSLVAWDFLTRYPNINSGLDMLLYTSGPAWHYYTYWSKLSREKLLTSTKDKLVESLL